MAYHSITGPITEADATAETNQLFDDLPTLPPDLLALGFKLIVRAPRRMFAVSTDWGCTGTKADIQSVITEARSISDFIAWAKAHPREAINE